MWQLQWGRGFAATEGAFAQRIMSLADLLQWGRGFAATEGFAPSTPITREQIASMGPWLRSHGRQVTRGGGRMLIEASMGPWLRSHGRGRIGPDRPGDCCGFNGAVASQPRKG